jgi:hypothetical protein
LIDQRCWRSIGKLRQWGGGIIILAKKEPLFVGSLFGVCLFLGVRLSRQNKKNRKKGRAKKKMEGTNGPDPLLMGMTTMGLILVM